MTSQIDKLKERVEHWRIELAKARVERMRWRNLHKPIHETWPAGQKYVSMWSPARQTFVVCERYGPELPVVKVHTDTNELRAFTANAISRWDTEIRDILGIIHRLEKAIAEI